MLHLQTDMIMTVLKKVLFFLLLIVVAMPSYGKVDVLSFDSSIVINEQVIEADAQTRINGIINEHIQAMTGGRVIRETLQPFYDDTFDFYIVLVLLLVFGIVRFTFPRYFEYLIRAFRSPSFGMQQLKDQIGSSVLPNLLMNIFFGVSIGIYLYFLFKLNMPQYYAVYKPSLIVAGLIGGAVLLYAVKYVILLFTSWVFNVRSVVGHYLYNVFLINKVLAVVLLPFTVLLAFASTTIAVPAMVVSLFLIGLLFVNRYIRSWQVLGPFFQYGKFHFFAYLCASEILPMALLTKLLIRGMYY